MAEAIPVTFLAVALLNLAHWTLTRRSGFLPSPVGIPGLVLDLWFWLAVVAILLASLHWMSAQVAMISFLAWGSAKALCAVWVRQFRLQFKLPRVDSPSN